MSTLEPLATDLVNCDAITKRNQEQSPLLRLPPELRNRIFGYVVGPPTSASVFLGHNGRRPRLTIKRPFKMVMGIGSACRQIRAETYLRYLTQNLIRFGGRQSFKRWMEASAAEEHEALRSIHVFEDDAHVPGFWEDVGKLRGLEKVVLSVTKDHEDAVEQKNPEMVISFFSNKLNSAVGHKVELEVV